MKEIKTPQRGRQRSSYDINNLEAVIASRIVNRLVINQHSVIIEFFDKYFLYTRKQLDYQD